MIESSRPTATCQLLVARHHAPCRSVADWVSHSSYVPIAGAKKSPSPEGLIPRAVSRTYPCQAWFETTVRPTSDVSQRRRNSIILMISNRLSVTVHRLEDYHAQTRHGRDRTATDSLSSRLAVPVDGMYLRDHRTYARCRGLESVSGLEGLTGGIYKFRSDPGFIGRPGCFWDQLGTPSRRSRPQS